MPQGERDGKTRRPLLRVLSLAAAGSIMTAGLALAGALAFFHSPAFLDLLEREIGGRLGRKMTVGSVTFGWGRLVVRHLALSAAGGGPPVLIIPSAECTLSLRGLLKGRIDSLALKRPRLLISLPGGGEGGGPVNLPVLVERGTVEEGEVIFALAESGTFTLRPLSLSLALERTSAGEGLRIGGKAVLRPFGTPFSFDTVLPAGTLRAEGGHLAVGPLRVGTQGAGRAFAATVRADAEITRKGDSLEALLRATLRDPAFTGGGRALPLEGIAAEATVRLLIPFGPGRLEAEGEASLTSAARDGDLWKGALQASYLREGGVLSLRRAVASSPVLGTLRLAGEVRGTGSPDATFAGTVAWAGASFESIGRHLLLPLGLSEVAPRLAGDISFEGEADGEVSGLSRWQAELKAARFAVDDRRAGPLRTPRDAGLSLEGTYRPEKEGSFDISTLRADVSGLPSTLVRGSLSRTSSLHPDLDLAVSTGGFPLPDAIALLAPLLPDGVPPPRGEGRVRGEATVTGTTDRPRAALLVSLDGARLSWGPVDAEGFEASLRLSPPPGGGYEGEVRAKSDLLRIGAEGSPTALLFHAVDLAAPFRSAAGGRVEIPLLSFESGESLILEGSRVVARERAASLRAALDVDAGERRASLTSIEARLDALGPLRGKVTLSGGPPPLLEGALSAEGIALSTVAERVASVFPPPASATPRPLASPALTGEGSLALRFDTLFPAEGPLPVNVRVDLAVQGGGFTSADGSRAVDGAALSAGGDLRFTLPLSTTTFAVTAGASGFEMLSGGFYGDFGERSLDLDVRGLHRAGEGTLLVGPSSLSLTDVGTLAFEGDVTGLGDSPRLAASLRLAGVSNAATFDLFLRENLREARPRLASLEVSGTSSADLSLTLSSGEMTCEGSIRTTGTSVAEEGGGLSLRGLDLDLPVVLSTSAAAVTPPPTAAGFLRVAQLAWGDRDFGGLDTGLAASRNAVAVTAPLRLAFMGGAVELGGLRGENLLDNRRRIRASLALEDIDLAELSRAAGLPPFSGRLSGRIPSLAYGGGDLRSEGEILLQVFGGRVRVSGVAARNLTGPVPSLEASIAIEEIDLARLTDTFDFGRISGVLEGSVRDLVISAGQPESFSARVETVRRKGVPQRIGVEALRKISILGSGASPDVLSRGIYRMFKEYRYEKMGFEAQLAHDTLDLRGVAAEGDASYLVKGGFLPPKADVISHAQKISFHELVERLRRIGRVTEKEGGGER